MMKKSFFLDASVYLFVYIFLSCYVVTSISPGIVFPQFVKGLESKSLYLDFVHLVISVRALQKLGILGKNQKIRFSLNISSINCF